MQTKTVRKHWWESRSAVLLQDFAKSCDGTYVPAVFKGWKTKRQHVLIELEQGKGTCVVTLTESDSSSGSGKKALVPSMQYTYQPARKLEFELFSAKRPVFHLFRRYLRATALPYSAMNKQFRARASHPSLLRSLLKQEGLAEVLEKHQKPYIKQHLKEQKAVLIFAESYKNADVKTLEANLTLMKLFIQALHDQGMVRKPK